jgi:hypothetical protein
VHGTDLQDLSKPIFFDPSPVVALARKERPSWLGDIEFPVPSFITPSCDHVDNFVSYTLHVEGIMEKGKAKGIRASVPITVRSALTSST